FSESITSAAAFTATCAASSSRNYHSASLGAQRIPVEPTSRGVTMFTAQAKIPPPRLRPSALFLRHGGWWTRDRRAPWHTPVRACLRRIARWTSTWALTLTAIVEFDVVVDVEPLVDLDVDLRVRSRSQGRGTRSTAGGPRARCGSPPRHPVSRCVVTSPPGT